VSGDPGSVRRLSEIGIREGEKIEVLQAGCPCIVRVGDSKFCVRNSGDFQIFVRPAEVAFA
jgi:ferrous iron transport protein A